MYDIQDLEPTNKEMALLIIVVFIFMVVVFGTGYMLGLRNAGAAKGNGVDDGAGQVGQHIQSAITDQREITERIDGLQGGAVQISGSLEKV